MTKIEEFTYNMLNAYSKMKWHKQSTNLLTRYTSNFENYKVEVFHNTYENFYGMILTSDDNEQYCALKSYEDGGKVVEKLFYNIDNEYNIKNTSDFLEKAIRLTAQIYYDYEQRT